MNEIVGLKKNIMGYPFNLVVSTFARILKPTFARQKA
jgi:hypothetical protein